MTPAPKRTSERQEEMIIDAAASCIDETSLTNFTMAAVSKKTGLSMGSIYKHMQSKEDVLVALGCRAQSHFLKLIDRVMALPLPPVARIVAIKLVAHEHIWLYGFGPQLETLLANVPVLTRASRHWLDEYIARDIETEERFLRVIRDACVSGELDLNGGRYAQDKNDTTAMADEIVTCVWAICVGHNQVQMQRHARQITATPCTLEIASSIVQGMQRLVNSYPWKTPLSDELLKETCRQLTKQGLR